MSFAQNFSVFFFSCLAQPMLMIQQLDGTNWPVYERMSSLSLETLSEALVEARGRDHTERSGSLLDAAAVNNLRKLFIANRDVEVEHYGAALEYSVTLLFDVLQSTESTDAAKLAASDTLSIWVIRSGALGSKNRAFHDLIPSLLNDERLDFLFSYTLDYWNETGSPLSNSLKDLFTKLVSLLKRYDSQKRFENWTSIALQVQDTRRVKYHLLEILSKELEDVHYILKKDPSFTQRSLSLINWKGLGALIGRCVSSLLKRLYVDEAHVGEWVSQYWVSVIVSLRDPKLRQGIQHHILPSLFKISPASFKIVVHKIEDDVDLLISCLNIGQQLAIEHDPFPKIVSKELIVELLVQENYKTKIFQLLTFSPKGSRPINSQVFEILQQYIPMFFVDTEVETRMEFISMFKQFLFRIKDSSYALNRDAAKMMHKKELHDEAQETLKEVEMCKEFLKWMIQFLKTLLSPGAPYQRLSSGLVVLRQIVESNLDPEILFNVDIDYPFKISIFDQDLKTCLLNAVLSTYNDIRSNATYLLEVSKIQWTVEEKLNLIESGFEMLSDYTKADAGSKVLEMCTKLFNDSQIYDRLVGTIPLTSDIQKGVQNPVDGFFQAIRLILCHDKKNKDPQALIDLCQRNWSFVKSILINDSPEGLDEFNVGSAQLVLSFAWRSTKESTLLLQEVLDMNISDEDILKLGELTLDQLATVRHRGAFSSVYPTFIKIASLCKKRMPGQNKKWLDANIELIQTKTQLITRRSGGLPFLITAVVSVERELIPYAFDKLFAVASTPVDVAEESEKMDIAQVHAFNCIKTLFIESQLANCCAPYLYKGLELSISTFNSKIWSMRNCSIMLFTALQNRLFGHKKLSARVFFSRFKGIKAILIKTLRDIGDDLESLFPVLTILSKLDSTPGYQELDEFLPLIRGCLETKHWKIRECASRALPALVTDSVRESLFLLDDCSTANQNKLHGYLLAVKVLNSKDVSVGEKLFKLFDDVLLKNECFATKKAYVDVLASFVIPDSLKTSLKELFISENSVFELDGSKQLYLQELFKLVVDNDTLDIGLTSKYFEVKLESLAYCATNNVENAEIENIAKAPTEFTYVRSKAIPLVENFDASELVRFATDQELYGEDIKRSCLELLGSFAARDKSLFEKWTDLIEKNSNDNEPFPVRMSALKSCLRYLNLEKNAQVSWFVYQFLTDDDFEVRDLASIVYGSGIEPWVNTKQFSQNFGQTSEEISIVVNEFLKFNPSLKTADDGKVLFNIEKSNIYRVSLEQHLQLSQMLRNGEHAMSKEQRSSVINHLDHIKGRAIAAIKATGGQYGTLTWASNEALLEDIYCIVAHLDSFGVSSADVRAIAQANGLHIAL